MSELAFGLLTALGCGLLIGLERERRKGSGPQRRSAGLRSFTATALIGALAAGLAEPGLVAVSALAVALLAAVSYARSHQNDPGLTTEVALFATFLIGALAAREPALATAAAVVLAVLLAARGAMHRFATVWLSEAELHDGLLLAALGLIALPLLPNEPLTWLGGLRPRGLLGLLVLLLGMQALGHFALRVAGPRRGLLWSGLLSGLVSSTAAIASLGARVRREPSTLQACAAAAVMSSAATWLQALLLLAALAPSAALDVLPAAGMGAAAALTAAGLLARRTAAPPHPTALTRGGMLQPREALAVAALLSGATVLISWAHARFGGLGLLGASALAGLLDAHAPLASLAAQHGQGGIVHAQLLAAMLLAIASNSATRTVTALVAGGAAYALRVGAGLLGSLLSAAAVAVWQHGLP